MIAAHRSSRSSSAPVAGNKQAASLRSGRSAEPPLPKTPKLLPNRLREKAVSKKPLLFGSIGTAAVVVVALVAAMLAGGGDVLYLYDYSSNYCTGTLYSYNKGNPKKIYDDVVALIPVADGPVIYVY